MASAKGVAIVTGGGRGIGAAIAKGLAADGYAVAVNYASNESAAAKTVAEIVGSGGTAIAVQADVAEEADVIRLFETVDRRLGAPAVLVNNGGVTGGFSRLADLPASALARVFSVNVFGAFLCCREAVRRMSTRRGGAGGSIVNVSSRAAQLGGVGEWIHYAASKGALDTLTVGLAREVAAEGIRVNAVAPGLIDTELHAAAGMPDRVERMAPTVPMARTGTAAEVADCVRFLVSPAAAYVTGAVLPVSGGR
ncbi:MAG TPA: SDR family oxidoreductase [Xanthobacteraceae bacterium]|nr:SDR family oxidoreductase [Xanthobacteraceae bacterium]